MVYEIIIIITANDWLSCVYETNCSVDPIICVEELRYNTNR